MTDECDAEMPASEAKEWQEAIKGEQKRRTTTEGRGESSEMNENIVRQAKGPEDHPTN
jgi:hypothetical protein